MTGSAAAGCCRPIAAPVRQLLKDVRQLRGQGLSERQALRLASMSASTLRHQPRDDGNGRLRERLTELAGQHRRHG